MSVCTFFASDLLLPRVDRREGGEFGIFPLRLAPAPCERPFAAELEAPELSIESAERILFYIQNLLKSAESVELWRVWLMDYWEFEDRPYMHTSVCRFRDLTEEQIIALDRAEVWNKPDKNNPERPSFYRLIVTR